MIKIAQIIISISKAIPALDSLVDKIIELKIKLVVSSVEDQMVDRKLKGLTIFNSIKKAETNEERRILSIAAADYTS